MQAGPQPNEDNINNEYDDWIEFDGDLKKWALIGATVLVACASLFYGSSFLMTIIGIGMGAGYYAYPKEMEEWYNNSLLTIAVATFGFFATGGSSLGFLLGGWVGFEATRQLNKLARAADPILHPLNYLRGKFSAWFGRGTQPAAAPSSALVLYGSQHPLVTMWADAKRVIQNWQAPENTQAGAIVPFSNGIRLKFNPAKFIFSIPRYLGNLGEKLPQFISVSPENRIENANRALVPANQVSGSWWDRFKNFMQSIAAETNEENALAVIEAMEGPAIGLADRGGQAARESRQLIFSQPRIEAAPAVQIMPQIAQVGETEIQEQAPAAVEAAPSSASWWQSIKNAFSEVDRKSITIGIM